MNPLTLGHLRIFLHIIAGCVWLGGQITLAAIVPVLRRTAPSDTTRAVAQQFQKVAWPAFAVLVVTGIWNLGEVSIGNQSSQYIVTLFIKLLCVAVSGIGAGIHALVLGPNAALGPAERAHRSKMLSGIAAGVGLIFGIGAALLGVML